MRIGGARGPHHDGARCQHDGEGTGAAANDEVAWVDRHLVSIFWLRRSRWEEEVAGGLVNRENGVRVMAEEVLRCGLRTHASTE